jgi:hypothetical protein
MREEPDMTPNMTTDGMTKDAGASTESTEKLRDELYRIIDEIGTSRAERLTVLKAKFEALWNQIGEPAEPTLH